MHPGEMQRLKIDVLEPVLLKLLAETSGHLRTMRGELAVLVQFAYAAASPHIARVWRGYAVRKTVGGANGTIALAIVDGVFAAAVEIQRHCRAATARAVHAAKLGAVLDGYAIIIQACADDYYYYYYYE